MCVAKEHAPLGTLVVQKLLYRVSPTLQYSGGQFVQNSAVVSFVERLSSCRRFKMH